MLEDVITEDTIESLVNRFYQKIRVDPELGPIFDAARFDRWLVVFAETAHEIHSHDIAETYIEKSRRISESLKLALYYKPEGKML